MLLSSANHSSMVHLWNIAFLYVYWRVFSAWILGGDQLANFFGIFQIHTDASMKQLGRIGRIASPMLTNLVPSGKLTVRP